MARAFWSGQLQISLVSFGVKLIPATEAGSEIHFHQIDRRTGQRVHHQKVSSEDEEPVEKDDVVKGYEYSKGKYIQLEPAEIEQLRIPSRHTIELTQFVPMEEIDPVFYERPYFLLPEKSSQREAFAVVRKALEETKEAGLGKIALGGREHLIAVSAPRNPKLRGMMAFTLRFEEELRNAAEYFGELKETRTDADQLSLAKELIQKRTVEFKPEKFKDEYEGALRELVHAKLKHVPLPTEEKPEPRGKVINLMDALRRSVSEKGHDKKAVGREGGAPARTRAGKHGLKVMHYNHRSGERRRRTA